jgi:hypothetical protein
MVLEAAKSPPQAPYPRLGRLRTFSSDQMTKGQDAPNRVSRGKAHHAPHPLRVAWPPSLYGRECSMSTDVVPPLAANMNAAFKKVRGAIGDTDPALRDLIVTRIIELAKDGVYDIEELSTRTLSSLKPKG